MAINDISLTAAMRTNLFSLQQTAGLLSRTQERLSTGKKVNSALDNPVSFFAAQANMARANDIAGLKDAMGGAIQTIQAANNGISAITSLIDQAKAVGQAAEGATANQIKIQFSQVTDGETVTIGGATYTAALSTGEATFDPATSFVAVSDMRTTVANLATLINANDESATAIGGTDDMRAIASGSTLILEAKSASTAITQGNYATYADVTGVTKATVLTNVDGYQVFSDRKALGEQYNELMNQIDSIANSSGYQGTNLLMNEDLNVRFEGSALNVKGFSATASDLGLSTKVSSDTSGTGWGWSVNSEINVDMGKLDVATSTLRSEASKLSTNLSIINVQNDFTTNLVNTLTEGANNLTLADMNEEGANMLMLQTRQALGTTSLSLASQAAQSVLRLFG
jgi:flagellin